MRRLMKAGFLFLGILFVLTACGGGGGGSTTTTTVALTSSKDTAVSNNTDAILLTATVSPSVTSGTVTFKISSGVGSFSTTSQVSTITTAITNGVATAQLTSASAGSSTVYATYNTTNSTTKLVQFEAQTVNLTASSPAALISDTITFTATVSPSTSSGSVLFSVVSGGAAATFVGGGVTVNSTISNGQATAVLQSTLVGTYTVRATYGTANSSDVSVKFADSTYPVMVLTSSTSYLLTAHDPLLVVASFYPSLSSGTLIPMTVSGGVISVNDATYGASATPTIFASGEYIGKTYVFFKSSSTGTATVTASYGSYPTTSTSISLLPEIGTSTKSVSLAASALTKIAGRNILDISFRVVNDAVSNAACYYKTITTPTSLTLSSQQNEANRQIVSLYTLSSSGVSIVSPYKLVDIVYGYNPIMAGLSIVPVSLHVYDGTLSGASVTLTADDFLIQ